jgi:hypothetical protein
VDISLLDTNKANAKEKCTVFLQTVYIILSNFTLFQNN